MKLIMEKGGVQSVLLRLQQYEKSGIRWNHRALPCMSGLSSVEEEKTKEEEGIEWITVGLFIIRIKLQG